MKYDYWHPSRRFGMFIHWGLYSITEWHEQAQLRRHIPRSEYEKLLNLFSPDSFDPEEWVSLAEEAGMKYICFTVKHCDGFCLWDTKQTDFNVMNTPYHKDVLKQLSDACAKRHIALCLYYSIADWHHPNAYNPESSHQIPPLPTDEPNQQKYTAYVRNQLKELLTGYGKIYGLFWDVPPHFTDRSINEMARQLQPGIMINDRGYDEGDFSTPERSLPGGNRFSSPTEACQSVGEQSWGYRWNEDYYSTGFLTRSIDKIMAMGGNYLLNVGPMPNGKIPSKAVQVIRNVGSWYQRVKESFEGADTCTGLFSSDEILVTRKENTLYLHFYQGLNRSGIILKPAKFLPLKIKVLNSGKAPLYGLDVMPSLHEEAGGQTPYLHIHNLPVDDYANEALVVKVECDSLESFAVNGK